MLMFSGKGFLLKDGARRCKAFRVYARSLDEAVFALNTAAGWMLVKPGTADNILGKPHAAPTSCVDGPAEVHLKWSGQLSYERVANLKRSRGALRLQPEQVSNPTMRVRKSVRTLLDTGGHRSTVRFSSEAWPRLNLLMKEFGLGMKEMLEHLIAEETARRRSR